jgi:hypothetical protein
MWGSVLVELVTGTCLAELPLRLLAMPLSSVCFTFGTSILFIDFTRNMGWTLPIRISSQAARQTLRPGIYPYIEDIVAVDGGGGAAYRERLTARYEASPVFRRMLRRLSWFWGIGAELVGVITTVLVFTLKRDVGYAVGWSLPFVWGGVWTILTIWYVRRELRRENEEWAIKMDVAEAL